MPTAKEELRAIVEELSEEKAERFLDYLNLRADPDTLTEAELAEVDRTAEEMRRGKYTRLDELERELGLHS